MNLATRLFLASTSLVSLGLAQSVPVPNVEPALHTSGLNTLVRNLGLPRTYQYVIAASQLSGIPVGAKIEGFSIRLAGSTVNPLGSWPVTNVTWADYEIHVGAAVAPAAATTTFATNFTSPPTMVRDGALVLQPNVFPNTQPPTAPNAWGEFYFDFQTSHTYTGGDLAIMCSHTGSDQAAAPPFPESVAVNAATYGVAFSQTTFQAPVGVSAAFCVARIHYGYGTGCPGTGGKIPQLVQNQNIVAASGGPLLLSIGNALPSTAGVMVFGFGTSALPLPNGCSLWTMPVSTNLTILDALGRSTYTINVPASVIGGFDCTSVVLDPGHAGGYVSTNGVSPRSN